MCDGAQHGDGELTPENDRHHPGRRQIHLHERDQRSRDQQFVGKRIHPLTKRRDLPASARQIPVEPVGQRGEAKNGRAENLLAHPVGLPAIKLRQEDQHQQGHQKDSANG